jgi:hypothetical protein
MCVKEREKGGEVTTQSHGVKMQRNQAQSMQSTRTSSRDESSSSLLTPRPAIVPLPALRLLRTTP